jgi:hypothetical protein
MKLQQLRQIIREEISEIKNQPTIIKFKDLKRAVIENYYEGEFGSTIDELVNIVDELGYKGRKAYDFILDSIINTNTGLISFEQLKQVVAKEYAMFKLEALGFEFETEEEIYNDEEALEIFKETLEEFNEASTPNELANILDGAGFNGKEAYDFIFDSILT